MSEVIIFSASELKKSRGFPDGTIRNWRGKKYKKVAGKWVRYTEGKKSEKVKEEKKASTVIDGVKLKSEKEYRKAGEVMIVFEPTYDEEAREEWGGENTVAASVVTAEWDSKDKKWRAVSPALDQGVEGDTIKDAIEQARELLKGDEIVEDMKLSKVSTDYSMDELGEEYWGQEY